MIIKPNESKFIPHPETQDPIRAVIVDVTPPEDRTGKFGTKKEFRIVYETEIKREDGTPHCVWSRGYTLSLDKKSNLRKDIQRILNRELKEDEQLDTETLIGLPVRLSVAHTHDDGNTYANIDYLKGYTGDNPLKPSGSFKRKKDRDGDSSDGKGSSYVKTEAPPATDDAPAEQTAWTECKIHVGRFTGQTLGSIPTEGVEALLEHWMPNVATAAKPSADDRRLFAALNEAAKILRAASQPTLF